MSVATQDSKNSALPGVGTWHIADFNRTFTVVYRAAIRRDV